MLLSLRLRFRRPSPLVSEYVSLVFGPFFLLALFFVVCYVHMCYYTSEDLYHAVGALPTLYY